MANTVGIKTLKSKLINWQKSERDARTQVEEQKKQAEGERLTEERCQKVKENAKRLLSENPGHDFYTTWLNITKTLVDFKNFLQGISLIDKAAEKWPVVSFLKLPFQVAKGGLKSIVDKEFKVPDIEYKVNFTSEGALESTFIGRKKLADGSMGECTFTNDEKSIFFDSLVTSFLEKEGYHPDPNIKDKLVFTDALGDVMTNEKFDLLKTGIVDKDGKGAFQRYVDKQFQKTNDFWEKNTYADIKSKEMDSSPPRPS